MKRNYCGLFALAALVLALVGVARWHRDAQRQTQPVTAPVVTLPPALVATETALSQEVATLAPRIIETNQRVQQARKNSEIAHAEYVAVQTAPLPVADDDFDVVAGMRRTCAKLAALGIQCEPAFGR